MIAETLHKPKFAAVDPESISTTLKDQESWVCWTAGAINKKGKFPKYPVHPKLGYKINAHKSENHLTFNMAVKAVSNGYADGVGFVLKDEYIVFNDYPMIIVGIDIDNGSNLSTGQIDELWEELGRPYSELSPSRLGRRMFCLSREPIDNRNQDGLEMYYSGRFLTVTGWDAKGEMADCTDAIKRVHERWFPTKQVSQKSTKSGALKFPPEETPRKIAWVMEMLSYINADCSYEIYRNVIWAIESTEWNCTEMIQRQWSMGAPGRFTEDGLTIIKASFDRRNGGITLGTLVHYAKLAGYQSSKTNKLNLEVSK